MNKFTRIAERMRELADQVHKEGALIEGKYSDLKKQFELRKKRADVAKTWAARIDALGGTREKFCIDYGLSQNRLSNYINGQLVPREPTVKKVEAALTRAEGKRK